MQAGKSPNPLPIPVSLDVTAVDLATIHVPRSEAIARLGLPHSVADDCDIGPSDAWAYEYACGLQVVIRFPHDERPGVVRADLPEVDHVVRHIPFTNAECAAIDGETLRRVLSQLGESSLQAVALDAFQVWRQGDDGNPFRIGSPTSQRDANCRVAEFESHGHKQLYWSERLGEMTKRNSEN